MTRRALLYLRQSDSSGAGDTSLSLDSQSSILTQDAARLGWTIVGEIRDADQKGWNDQRPGLLEVYDRCRAGDADMVAVWSVSRLARSLRILETVADELKAVGVTLYSHEEPWANDPLFRQILGAVAEQDTRDKAAHIKRAVLELQRRGVHHGVVPWGYLRPERGQPLRIDPHAGPLVREMFELRASGVGPAGIAAELSRRGVSTPLHYPDWRTSTVCHMLRHIAHRGAVKAGDEIIEHAHPAIVDAALWQRAQVQDTSRRHPRPKQVTSWLEGLVEHACGQAMYVNQPGQGNYGAYLRCRDSGRSSRFGAEPIPPCPHSPRQVRVDRIEPVAWAAIVTVLHALLDPDVIVEDAQRRFRDAAPTAEGARKEAQERKDRAVARRKRFLGLYGDGVISRAELDVEVARATAEQAEADRLLSMLPTLPDEAAICSQWSTLHDLADVACEVPNERRGDVLRVLGVAIVAPSGIKIPGKGGADAGRVSIRLRRELSPFWACAESGP